MKTTKHHRVEALKFEGDQLSLRVDSGEHRFRLADISSKLARATPIQRETFEISPAGYGIHWPLLDEDLSIDGLLRTERTMAATPS